MKDNRHMWKNAIAKLTITFMVVMSLVIISPVFADAAVKPTLTRTTRNILVGCQYNLNVKNKTKKATYVWSTSDKKIATVDKRGVVTGVRQGIATITCKIKTSDKTYNLVCKVTIIKPAKLFMIKNKVTALNVGQSYNLNRTIVPSTSKDKTTWTSSNTAIAAPDKNGKFTALKEGTVAITGTTLSGATDCVTIKVVDKNGTVTNQSQLDELLGSGAALITIKTTDPVNLVIAKGDYSNQKLVVEAPNSDITNYGKFASIEIKQIKANSWYENAIGNFLKILAADSRIVVGSNAKVSIEVSEAGAILKIENNGVVEELFVAKEADIDISGDSDEDIPVVIDVPGITITSSVSLNLECKAKTKLILLPGAEKTKVQAATTAVIPDIKGDVTLNITVGSGDTATEQTVKGTPITVTPTTGGTTGGGTQGGGTTSMTYTLAQSYTNLTAINVTYKGVTYTVDSDTLVALKRFLGNDQFYLDVWKAINTTGVVKTYGTGANAQTVTVSGTAGSFTKTVSFSGAGSKLNGKTYTVTVTGNNSVTVSNGTLTFTITKVDDKTLTISPAPTGLTFSPTF
ncbi:MAG: Ig-like domain-containing protein [Herbinix sp.]|nr:Ig-like domain-containing protein [Herbinix sp.]